MNNEVKNQFATDFAAEYAETVAIRSLYELKETMIKNCMPDRYINEAIKKHERDQFRIYIRICHGIESGVYPENTVQLCKDELNQWVSKTPDGFLEYVTAEFEQHYNEIEMAGCIICKAKTIGE